MTDARTIVFFPEGAYGPTNNCVGIGAVLRLQGHRVVFVIEESFAGTLEDLQALYEVGRRVAAGEFEPAWRNDSEFKAAGDALRAEAAATTPAPVAPAATTPTPASTTPNAE